MKYLILILSVLIFVNCSTSPTETSKDEELARNLADSAKAALEQVMYDVINGAEDVNFQVPYNLYQQAYNADRDNLEANFGFALTNMMMINQQQEVNDVFEAWEDFIDEDDVEFNKTAQKVRPVFPTTKEYLAFPQKKLVKMLINFPKAALMDAPQFNSMQNIIDSYLIPRLETAIAAFDIVDDDPNFVFTVSPRMQGDLFADELEIDLTEIYAMEVMLNALNMFAHTMVSYNVDVWGYDSAQALQVFSKGGDFLTLRNGAAPMQRVKSSFYAAMDKALSGLTFLFFETDGQANDIIQKDDLTQEDIDELLLEINDIKNNIDAPQQFVDDWDDDPFTPEEAVTINFNAIFNTPIADFKALLPDYTIMIGSEDIFGNQYNYENYHVGGNIMVDSSAYYQYSKGYWWDEDGGEDSWSNSTFLYGSPFDAPFDSLKEELTTMANLQNIYMSIYWYGYLNQGLNYIEAYIYVDYETASDYNAVYIPAEFMWDAATFNNWIFPDPTFSGLLPGMTDAEFKRIFGFNEANWQ